MPSFPPYMVCKWFVNASLIYLGGGIHYVHQSMLSDSLGVVVCPGLECKIVEHELWFLFIICASPRKLKLSSVPLLKVKKEHIMRTMSTSDIEFVGAPGPVLLV